MSRVPIAWMGHRPADNQEHFHYCFGRFSYAGDVITSDHFELFIFSD